MFRIAVLALIASTQAIKIDLESTIAAMDEGCGEGLTKDEAKGLFKHVDANKDGEVDWKEAKRAAKKAAKQMGYKLTKEDLEDLKKLGGMMDADKNGKVSKKEYEAAVDYAWPHVDTNGDGKVNLCEAEEAFDKHVRGK